jgi:REP element-mobilizing transposase RayT
MSIPRPFLRKIQRRARASYHLSIYLALDPKLQLGFARCREYRDGTHERDLVASVDHSFDVTMEKRSLRVEIRALLEARPRAGAKLPHARVHDILVQCVEKVSVGKGVRNLFPCYHRRMGRAPRTDVANYVYHVLNRANGRATLFKKEGDYTMFETVLREAKERTDMRILAYCIMPNHWHLVLYPRKNGNLSTFVNWLTLTHTQRWHAAHRTIGHGHLYQGRYKSFLCETDAHFIQLVRYVERNPLRAHLVPERVIGRGEVCGGVALAPLTSAHSCTPGRSPCRAAMLGWWKRRSRSRNWTR